MEVTVRLRRKTGNNFLIFSRAQIFRDNIADEVGRSACFSRHRSEQSYRRTCRSTTLVAELSGDREHVARLIRHVAGLRLNTPTVEQSITVRTGLEDWLAKCQPKRTECSRSPLRTEIIQGRYSAT